MAEVFYTLLGSLSNKSNKHNKQIIKETSVNVQYGLSGSILMKNVTATKQHLIIEELNDDDEKSEDISPPVCIEWNNLVNIDDLNNQNTLHSFQLLFKNKLYPSIYIYCETKKKKQSWIKIFEQMCPRIILTKELQTVKRCAVNLGFTESQIEKSLITYHEKFGTMYNVNVFIGTITDSDEKDNNDETIDKTLQCSICHKIYDNPVRNIYDKTYCFVCIKQWFDIIKNEQTQIRDPYTNQPLPQHCRLLIPHFTKMALVWNHNRSQNEKISDGIYGKIQSVDELLNDRRKKVLCYLQSTENCEQIAMKLADNMLKSEQGILDHKQLNDLMSDSMQCYEWLCEIKDLIKRGSDIYNNAIKNIIDNDIVYEYLFEWKEPKWDNFIDKNVCNFSEVYQVDESLVSEIQEHTIDAIKLISDMLKQQKLNTKQIGQEIIKIILKKQSVIFNDENDEKCEEKIEYISKQKRINMERIMYKEKHGNVSTKCIQEISECIKHNKPFELYHNDLNHKSMNREQLIRFLQTAGVNGIENQYYIYKSFAVAIKDKMIRLCSYLKSLNSDKFKKFQYFKHLKSVDIIEPEIINQNEFTSQNDKIELKVKFDCDYDEHLAKYNNNKQLLAKEIKRQMLKQLKLKNAIYAEKYIMIQDIQKGSIDARIIFALPLIAIVGGGLDFINCVKQYNQNPNFYVATKRAILQGVAVGGGIGCIAGAAIGIALFNPIGLVVGCAIAGTVIGAAICGLIGYGLWKHLNKRKRNQQIIGNDNDDNGNDGIYKPPNVNVDVNDPGPGYNDDNRPRRVYIDQPGGGNRWMSQIIVNHDDINARVKQNGDAWVIRLECNCEVEYDGQTEGGYMKCELHDEWSCVKELETVINEKHGINGVRRRSVYAVRNLPQVPGDDFDIEESDSDGDYDD